MQFLLKVDPVTAKGMRNAHRGTAAFLCDLYNRFHDGTLPSATHNQFYTTVQAMDRLFLESAKELEVTEEDCRLTEIEIQELEAEIQQLAISANSKQQKQRLIGFGNATTRLGNTGTVLSVSLGEVKRFHIDKGDYKRYPSVVFCNKAAILQLALEHGGRYCLVNVQLAAGDVVGFSASQFLHQLIRDPRDTSNGQFLVFTAWTETQTLERVQEMEAVKAEHFFVV